MDYNQQKPKFTPVHSSAENMSFGIRLHVFGDFACFTRPEMKAERCSYDTITPSAARGLLEAIYWKPQIRWAVDKIHVLRPIKFTSIRRNELGGKMSLDSAASAMKDPTKWIGTYIEEDRQQRGALILRDVGYVLEAHIEIVRERCDQTPDTSDVDLNAKHVSIFTRRAEAGQCFHQPCFGNREFSASFELLQPTQALPASTLIEKNRDLGFMLHDCTYRPSKKAGDNPVITPKFFHAVMLDGCIKVPAFNKK